MWQPMASRPSLTYMTLLQLALWRVLVHSQWQQQVGSHHDVVWAIRSHSGVMVRLERINFSNVSAGRTQRFWGHLKLAL
jgi:hypothetical protein